MLATLVGCSGDPAPNADGKGCAATVHVFLETSATPQRERRVGELINDAPGVIRSTFHSRREAYRDFKRQYRKQPENYEAKRMSDFPARYEVIVEPHLIEDFELSLTAASGVDSLIPGGCATGSPAQ